MAANRERGEVEVLLDGTAYTWRLTTNAACALETRTGQKFGEVLTAADTLSLRALRDLVWLLLQDYHAGEFPTIESAGEFIDRMGLLSAVLKFRELLEVNQPRAGGAAQAAHPSDAGWDWRRLAVESRRLGLSRQDFWTSTPRELFDEIDALMLRRQDERDRDVTLAWTMVNLAAGTWAKGRVPELQGLLTAGRPARPQSVAEQKAVLEVLAQRLGRRLTTRHDRKGRDGTARQPA